MKVLASVLCLALVVCCAGDAASSLFADRTELVDQLSSRRGDLKRTEQRITELEQDTANAQVSLSRMRLESGQTLAEIEGRAGLMYRISRRGGAFRYLLTADSITEMLGRATILKKLIKDQLYLLRDQNRRTAEIDDRISTNKAELKQAREMQTLLTNTIGELKRQL